MSLERWDRCPNLKFPTVFSKFVTSDNTDSSKLVEYRIEDIPESRYEEACEFMVRNFLPYEPKLVSRNARDDPLVAEDYYNKYMNGIRQRVSVACFKMGSDDFVAVNILEVLGRNDATNYGNTKSKTCADINEAVDYIVDRADLFNRHNVDYYLSGTGLAVDPQYLGRGIATEMIKARQSMLRFYDLKVTSTGFASIGAQKAAAKAGCVVDYSISYEELSKIRPNWNFLGTNTECYVQMILISLSLTPLDNNIMNIQIYSKFKAFDGKNEKVIEYRIQDLPEHYFDAALNLLAADYMPDETFSSCLDLPNKPESVEAYRNLWHNEMRSKISIACFTNDDDNELVAVDVLSVYSKNSKKSFEISDPDVAHLYEILAFVTKKCDIFGRFNVDKFLTDQGLCTSRKYRHRGIATEMLKTRIPIMKKLGISLTSSDFSVIGSQKASERADYKEIWSICYDDLAKEFPSVDFSKAKANRLITKILKIDS